MVCWTAVPTSGSDGGSRPGSRSLRIRSPTSVPRHPGDGFAGPTSGRSRRSGSGWAWTRSEPSSPTTSTTSWSSRWGLDAGGLTVPRSRSPGSSHDQALAVVLGNVLGVDPDSPATLEGRLDRLPEQFGHLLDTGILGVAVPIVEVRLHGQLIEDDDAQLDVLLLRHESVLPPTRGFLN